MTKRILVTGAFGQIGSELVPILWQKYGKDSIIALGHRYVPPDFKGILETAEITDQKRLKEIVKKYKINTVYHLVAILSAKGEENPSLTWEINVQGLKNILDLAAEYRLRVFWPSSIAVFGPTTPKVNTPQKTILEPTTMYGVTKVAGELLCQYYFLKYGVDVRSVRYPGVISFKTPPSGGTTDWAVGMFYGAVKSGEYQCFVKKDTVLPMIYTDDAIRATLMIMETEPAKITIRTSYSLAGVSFSPEQLARQIQKYLPLKIIYAPDERQKIADSWPKTIDDRWAKKDWGWQPKFDLAKMTKVMIDNLKKKFST